MASCAAFAAGPALPLSRSPLAADRFAVATRPAVPIVTAAVGRPGAASLTPPPTAATAATAATPSRAAAAARRAAVTAAAAAAAVILAVAPPPLPGAPTPGGGAGGARHPHPPPAAAEVTRADGFIPSGSASTSQTGSKKTLTRGVDLHGSNFAGAKLAGVSFQSSNLRDSVFAGCDLTAASFFDTDLVGADFRGAQLGQANFELANMRRTTLDGAVLVESYISSTTKLDGVSIVGADFTDVLLRKDQQRYLCSIASGTNEVTGVDTAESLMCP